MDVYIKALIIVGAAISLSLNSTAVYADPCVEHDWHQFSDSHPNVYLQLCVGTFKYDGGGVANYFRFKNLSTKVVDFDCDGYF
jgi:hypothetical protein